LLLFAWVVIQDKLDLILLLPMEQSYFKEPLEYHLHLKPFSQFSVQHRPVFEVEQLIIMLPYMIIGEIHGMETSLLLGKIH